MVRLVMGYVSIINWEFFFGEVINWRVYLNLEVVFGLVSEYEKFFLFLLVVCYELEVDDVCIYSDINKEY